MNQKVQILVNFINLYHKTCSVEKIIEKNQSSS